MAVPLAPLTKNCAVRFHRDGSMAQSGFVLKSVAKGTV